MLCRLCGADIPRLARSHIIPVGFIRRTELIGLAVCVGRNGEGRKLRKGIYDREILCQKCEHEIFAPLDEYACKILIRKDFQSSSSRDLTGRGVRILSGKGIERRLLRRFLASFLWRCSVSRVQEMAEVDIGNHYEVLIGRDLLDEKPCDYIDALIMFGHDDIAKTTIFMPVGTRFRKDGNVANGFEVFFPGIWLRVSLDQRPNPLTHMFDCSADGKCVASMSLAGQNEGSILSMLDFDAMPGHEDMVMRLFDEYESKTETHPDRIFEKMLLRDAAKA